jgi:diguanylate cyclase (GGDEF)-like protein/PAS domain S-box-containing protein
MSVAAESAATPVPQRGGATGFRAPSRTQLNAVIEAQRVLACAPPDPEVIFRLLAETAWSVLGCSGAIASQPVSDSIVVRGLAGTSPSGLGATIPVDGTLTGVALRTKTSHICDDWLQDTRTRTEAHAGPLSFVVVPLVYEGEVIALLGAHESRLAAFDDQDLELLAMLADVGANRLAHALDIGARRAADAALHDARRRLEAALDLAGLATWQIDLATGEQHWSPKMFAIFGLDPSHGAPDTSLHRSLLHPDDYDAFAAMGQSCLENQTPVQSIVRGRLPDGSQLYLSTQMDVATDSTGTVTTLWGTTQDVTEHETAARVLGASEQHFRVAFDNAPIGMSMISLTPGSEGRYLRANAEFCAMLGYSMDELASLTMLELTSVDDVEKDRARFTQLISGEAASVAFDKKFRRKDGDTVFAWVTSAVAYGPAGEPLYLISHALDMTGRRQQQAELERLALTDTLTGLANRTLLTDRLDQALARLQRVEGSCALLMLDIDRFKLVNDTLGHQVGDALLVEVASRIEAVSRADSTVARLGGDEFVVLVEGLADPDGVHHIAARLLETLRRPYIIDDAADSLVVTVSIGISVATTAERSHGDLYREADLALYRAKDSGRDQYALFDSALRLRVEARMDAENLLRRALAEGFVTPFFQPLIDMTSGRIRSVECLARIAMPDGSIVPPADFVEVAEETGLIVELDARMFELGMRQFALWSAQPDLELHSISTNVSARSLEDSTFVDRMSRAMTWYGVTGSAVRVEITERSLLAPSPVVVESLRRIAEIGILVGLDDFGTGYSALAYLQRFDLTFLKIDRSFVSRLGNRRDDAVVAAVIDLAHALELVVVAEGVETPEQLAALREMGCDRAQGFLMGRPLPPDKLVELIRTLPSW